MDAPCGTGRSLQKRVSRLAQQIPATNSLLLRACRPFALSSALTVYVKQVQTTAASNTFDGLTPGQIYNVQLNAGLTSEFWFGQRL
jgi:hypothetical protein